MKKMLLVAVMAAAATFSCSKNEAFENTSDNNAISFRPAVGKAVKATDVTTATLPKFGVMSILSTGDYAGTTGNVYFEDTYTSSAGSWTTGSTHYWPVAVDAKLSFFGYYDGSLSALSSTGGAYPVITDYTVADAAANQKDLIVASKVNQVKPANGTDAIGLTFKHALSKINVSAKVDDATYFAKIKSISFDKIYNKATFTYNGTEATVGAWTLSKSSTGTYSYFSGNQKITSSTASPIYADETGKAMMFIPQLKADHSSPAMAITVSYELYVTAGGIDVLIDTQTKSVAVDDLAMGKYYRYTLSIPKSGTEIKLEVTTVTDWGTETEVPKTV